MTEEDARKAAYKFICETLSDSKQNSPAMVAAIAALFGSLRY